MNFKALLDVWSSETQPQHTDETYEMRLPVDDAARIHALADLFPNVDRERIITDLLGHALDRIEAAIPYEPGSKVIREDEFGDPVYEDEGLTPKFRELVNAHRATLGKRG